MKAVQLTFDEQLLARLDRDDEVRRDGRSAVVRRAVAEYLRRRRNAKVAEAYRRAYGRSGGLDSQWEGWAEEGSWPDE